MTYIGSGLTRFNTADELTVTGDAQIDTTTLVVDSTNNRVGVGTASPATALDVTGTVTADALSLGDNEKIQLGASQDLQIFHDGSTSRIVDAGTGNLTIEADELIVRNAANNETKADFTTDGAVNLYYNNAAKLATSSTGATITGDLTVGDGHTIGDDANDNLTLTSSSGENIKFDSAAGNHLFFNNGTEKARFDSSDNFLVGATSTASSDFGAKFLNDGTSKILAIHRQAADGEFIQFSRGGNANGALSAVSGDLAIYSKDTGHEGLRFGNGAIVPVDNTGAGTDDACNLGGATQRFRDLYLSSGAYIGGTAAVNHLDDYEEGEFDMTATRSGTSGTSNLETLTGQYIKVGRLVFINFVRKQNNSPYFKVGTAGFSSGQDVTISSNLPFAPDSASAVRLGKTRALSDFDSLCLGWRNGTSAIFLGTGDSNDYVIENDCTTSTNQSNFVINCQFCYYTTS